MRLPDNVPCLIPDAMSTHPERRSPSLTENKPLVFRTPMRLPDIAIWLIPVASRTQPEYMLPSLAEKRPAVSTTPMRGGNAAPAAGAQVVRVQELVYRARCDPPRVGIAVGGSRAWEVVSHDVNLAAVYLVDVGDVAKSACNLSSPPGDSTNGGGVVAATVVASPRHRVAPVPGIWHPVLLQPPCGVQGAVVVAVRSLGEATTVMTPRPAT
jgi:hypothetical protein